MSTEPVYSDRGFAYWEPTPTTYGGAIDVHESSAASGPHLWVTIDLPGKPSVGCHLTGPPVDHPGVAFGVAPGSAGAHLTMEQARDLRDKLDAAISHSEERFA